MPVFLVTPLGHNADQVGEAIRANVAAEDFLELPGRAGWLITSKGTSIEVSNQVGLTSPESDFKPTLGSAMVTTVGSYYGRAPTTIWEWLKTRIENPR